MTFFLSCEADSFGQREVLLDTGASQQLMKEWIDPINKPTKRNIDKWKRKQEHSRAKASKKTSHFAILPIFLHALQFYQIILVYYLDSEYTKKYPTIITSAT
jgi:hypothetical protein